MNLLGFQNPFDPEQQQLLGLSAADMRRKSIARGLQGIGLGLMTGNWQDAVAGGILGAREGKDAYMQDAYDKYKLKSAEEEKNFRNQQREWEIMDRQNQQVAINSLDPEVAQMYRISPGLAGDYIRSTDPRFQSAQAPQTYAPIPYNMGNGKIGYGIPDASGRFTPLDAPGEGFLSPYDKSFQTKTGAAAAEQTMGAAGDLTAADMALGILDQIEQSPNIGRGTGFSSLGNSVPGTAGRDFQNLVDQAKNGAFLTAIDQLRGMGALSNMEGQAATSAITRMDTATSEEAFRKALQDYRAIVVRGKAKAQAILGSAPMPVPGAPQATGTPQRRKFNPATGELE